MTKFIKFLRYFFFIGTNWNFRLAFFTIIHEMRGEKKYHVDTIDIDRLNHHEIKGKNLKHASIYQGVNYYTLEKAFDYLKENAAKEDLKNLVDYGCGKGRVLVVAAAYGFTKITGVDFSPALCRIARQNVERNQTTYPNTTFNIVCEDAVQYPIDADASVFFFFNPFDETVLLTVLKNLLASLKQHPRKVYIIYVNPLLKEMFLSAGFEEEYYMKKLEYLEVSILSNDCDD